MLTVMQDINISTYFQVGLLVFFLVGIIAGLFRHLKRPTSKYSSVLLSYYTLKSDIIPLSAGTLAGSISYASMFIAKKSNPLESVTAYFVYLPFTSDTRLLAIASTSRTQINPSLGKSIMEPVELEGDFAEYFSLYANKYSQHQARYVLDPDAMVHAMDFLSNYDWEIINNELIIVSDDPIRHSAVESFIKNIEPSIKSPNSEVDALVRSEYRLPFGYKMLKKDSDSKLFKCPICSQQTKKLDGAYVCQKGHGQLMTGAIFAELPKDNQLVSPQNTKDNLNCPNCKSVMVKVNYGLGKVIIDSCINCPYRWIDKGELLE